MQWVYVGEGVSTQISYWGPSLIKINAYAVSFLRIKYYNILFTCKI